MSLTNGRQVYEIVCSPLALVVGLRQAKWQRAPGRLPFNAAGEWAVGRPVTLDQIQSSANCAMALQVWRHGLGVRIKVGLWEVSQSPGAVEPTATTEEIVLN